MKKIRLDIFGLSYSQAQSGAYALVLNEQGGTRRLPIIIGGYEAQAIAVELENMTPSRPLTHDLFKNFSISFGIHINEVTIYNLKEGVFYSKIVCSNGEKQLEIDARTSDAIALAVRFNCPIYTFDFILSQAGVEIEGELNVSDEPNEITKPEKTFPPQRKKPKTLALNDFSHLSTEELNEALINAIDNEDYEAASKIRDELTRRNK
ncbi:MAG: bifunctional nuclease family protein [Bacteroidia bacterium]|jgi:bifunctional DNase/RNase